MEESGKRLFLCDECASNFGLQHLEELGGWFSIGVVAGNCHQCNQTKYIRGYRVVEEKSQEEKIHDQ